MNTTEWVRARNVEEFKRKLADEKDLNKRRILEELLAKEEARRGQPDED